MHNRSKVSLDTLQNMFSDYPIRFTNPPMTEVCINYTMNDELCQFKGVVFNIIRTLLEAGNEINDDKVLTCCTMLSVVFDVVFNEKELCLQTRSKVKQIEKVTSELVASVKHRILNEDYLNHKSVDCFKNVKCRV